MAGAQSVKRKYQINNLFDPHRFDFVFSSSVEIVIEWYSKILDTTWRLASFILFSCEMSWWIPLMPCSHFKGHIFWTHCCHNIIVSAGNAECLCRLCGMRWPTEVQLILNSTDDTSNKLLCTCSRGKRREPRFRLEHTCVEYVCVCACVRVCVCVCVFAFSYP